MHCRVNNSGQKSGAIPGMIQSESWKILGQRSLQSLGSPCEQWQKCVRRIWPARVQPETKIRSSKVVSWTPNETEVSLENHRTISGGFSIAKAVPQRISSSGSDRSQEDLQTAERPFVGLCCAVPDPDCNHLLVGC